MIRKILNVVLAGMLICCLARFAMGESAETADVRMDPAEETRNMEGA